jgi:glutamate--cysteine ligase
MADAAAPITSTDDLLDYFRSGEKPVERWRIGTEHEKIAIDAESGRRVPYEGDRGIGALLQRIATEDDWKPIYEGANVVALLKDGASITLEPGGQIELSGAPLRTARETCKEFNAHVDLVNRLSADMGIVFLALGVDPLHAVPDIPVMPKGRYDIMREYLPTRGDHGLEMMHASATVQANFDYASEDDMVDKLRTAMGITPIVSAIFANSCLSEGRENGFVTKRLAIWSDTDPDRCGLLDFVYEDGETGEPFGYRRYAEWALDVPMFFLVRDGRYRPAHTRTFRQFLEDGFEGERATIDDWDTHLTTLFPEVRLKRIIEVRGADAVPRGLICALPVLWKGILYDAEARQEAWALVRDFTREQREEAQLAVARQGLAAEIGGESALELARAVAASSGRGLRRILERGETDSDERSFLDPIHEILDEGRSPGEAILELWRGPWQGSTERLIDYARY